MMVILQIFLNLESVQKRCTSFEAYAHHGKLGTIFARAGHDVVFSYARSEGKLKKLARDAGPNARAGHLCFRCGLARKL